MRYAIYFTPVPQSALWHFGSSAIGYDAVTRETCAFLDESLWREPAFVRAQESPARYGFHATLKAPFELASGASETVLMQRAAAFATRNAPILLPAMEVALLGDFVALRPLAKDAGLNRLAGACVQELDDLRGPMGDADRKRRVSQGLTTRQLAYLERWGYPYVFDEFRFHMTLTGALAETMQPRALATLTAMYGRIGTAVAIDAISLLAQPTRDSRFHLLERFPLRAASPAAALDR